ncbi:MAG TPA: hypothetical protein VN461_09990 [Vicinamibacteria bacterium]|jgi:hypothetical protein|nr:hypothetical protein [Vicinamibacteria bacterium]
MRHPLVGLASSLGLSLILAAPLSAQSAYPMKDINPGPGYSNPLWLNNVRSTLFLAADGGAYDTGSVNPGTNNAPLAMGVAGMFPLPLLHPSQHGGDADGQALVAGATIG